MTAGERMRKAAAALTVLVLFSCRSNGGRVDDSRAKVATITDLSGSVQVLRGGSSDWSAIQKGLPLYDDDRLRTFKGARATLSFTNGSTLKVDEESLISLGGLSLGGGVVVERGTVEGELMPGLKVNTPSVEAEATKARDIVFQ
jgi:hypothetical protein